LTSPLVDQAAHPAGVALAFDASVDFKAAGGLTDGDRGNEFLGVQGLKGDGTWTFLTVRYTPVGSGTSNDTTIAGKGAFHAEVRLNADGNQLAGLATNTRLRIVVQTDASGSQEDGGVPPTPGAAVVDNLTVRENGTDIVPPVDCEDGTTGSWSLAGLNGVC